MQILSLGNVSSTPSYINDEIAIASSNACPTLFQR